MCVLSHEFKKANDEGHGMGLALSHLKATQALFDRAKPLVAGLPSNYVDTYNSKISEVTKVLEKANHENKSIYFEKEIPID